MRMILDFLWPHLEVATSDEREQEELQVKQDVDDIRNASWSDTSLAEARNLSSLENERRRASETKASIYLAVIAAIVPVLASVGADFYETEFEKFHIVLRITTLLVFVAGLAYLLASGMWAFRTLAVSVHYRVDVRDLINLRAESDETSALVKEILVAVRLNRGGVNRKTSCIRMAHEFLIRTLFTFALILATLVIWKPIQSVFEWVFEYIKASCSAVG